MYVYCLFQYIKALRKQADIDKLRLARKAMSDVYPLTPTMWQQWANDEISLLSVGLLRFLFPLPLLIYVCATTHNYFFYIVQE